MRNEFSVVTIVKNRTQQLSNLIANLEQSELAPSELIVVWMTSPSSNSLIQSEQFSIKHKFATSEELPLAQARNKGFKACSFERIVHLDVDCVCDPALFSTMMKNWKDNTIHTTNIIPLTEMPDNAQFEQLMERSELHVLNGRRNASAMHNFQSAVFGVSRSDFDKVGGFDEQYHGFGIGDIDFATRCHAAGIGLEKLSLTAFHQYRANYQFPINHLLDIVTNANLFKAKWGYYPATDWLSAFVSQGFVNQDFEHSGLTIARMPSEEEIHQALHYEQAAENADHIEKLSA